MATIAKNAEGKAGLGKIGDARIAAHAKAIGAEVFSPDKGFAKNWRSVQQQLGVTVAAEVRNIQELPKGSVQDFKVGRRLLGLPDIDIDANGNVTRGQRGMVVPSGSKVGRPVTTTQGTMQSGQRGMVVTSRNNGWRPVTTAQGTIQSGQRGMMVPSGSNIGRPVTTTQGTIQSGQRGGGGGGGSAGAVAGGVLNAVITLAIPVIKAYFAKHLQAKWKKEQQDQLEALLFYYMPAMNGEIISRSEEIRREKANGKKAYVRVQTHAEFTPTDMGPAMTKLEMLGFHVYFEGDETMDFSYLETKQGFAARAGRAYVTHQRDTHLIPI
jgi:hypothetical protein